MNSNGQYKSLSLFLFLSLSVISVLPIYDLECLINIMVPLSDNYSLISIWRVHSKSLWCSTSSWNNSKTYKISNNLISLKSIRPRKSLEKILRPKKRHKWRTVLSHGGISTRYSWYGKKHRIPQSKNSRLKVNGRHLGNAWPTTLPCHAYSFFTITILSNRPRFEANKITSRCRYSLQLLV